MLLSIEHLMTTQVVTISQSEPLSTAKEIFDHHDFNHLLVVDDKGTLAGVLSHRDLWKALSPNIDTRAESIRDSATLDKQIQFAMSQDPITISKQLHVNDAAKIILKYDIGCLPVVEDNKLVGIITWKDLLKAYIKD